MILITGASGLIGSELTAELRNNRIDFVEFDIRGRSAHDIRDVQQLRDALRNRLGNACEGIIHLAAVSRVAEAEDDPRQCYEVNVQGTQNLVALAQQHATPWVVFASSREVYGQPDQLPVTELCGIDPINTYGRSKVEAEKAIEGYRQLGGRVSILRLPNVYGNLNDNQKRVIPQFARCAAEGGALRIEGEHKQFDFVHVQDVVRAITGAMQYMKKVDESLPVLNVASGRPYQLGGLAELAQQSSAHELQVKVTPSQDVYVDSYYADPLMINETLGWYAAISIEEGFTKLVESYRRAATTAA